MGDKKTSNQDLATNVHANRQDRCEAQSKDPADCCLGFSPAVHPVLWLHRWLSSHGSTKETQESNAVVRRSCLIASDVVV